MKGFRISILNEGFDIGKFLKQEIIAIRRTLREGPCPRRASTKSIAGAVRGIIRYFDAFDEEILRLDSLVSDQIQDRQVISFSSFLIPFKNSKPSFILKGCLILSSYLSDDSLHPHISCSMTTGP